LDRLGVAIVDFSALSMVVRTANPLRKELAVRLFYHPSHLTNNGVAAATAQFVHPPFALAGHPGPPKRGRAPASEVLRKFCEI
jgi:hypothetical protein